MVNNKTMSEQQQIEEILEEANAFGLRKEVKELAESRVGFWDIDKVEIYNWAFMKYLKDV